MSVDRIAGSGWLVERDQPQADRRWPVRGDRVRGTNRCGMTLRAATASGCILANHPETGSA